MYKMRMVPGQWQESDGGKFRAEKVMAEKVMAEECSVICSSKVLTR